MTTEQEDILTALAHTMSRDYRNAIRAALREIARLRKALGRKGKP